MTPRRYHEDGTDEAHNGVLVGEDPDDIGPALDLLVEALQRVSAVKFGAVLGREGDVSEDVVLGLVHQGGELMPAGPELVGDVAPGLPGALPIRLDEGLPDRCGDHGMLALRNVRQGVAHEVHAAALPSSADDPGDRRG